LYVAYGWIAPYVCAEDSPDRLLNFLSIVRIINKSPREILLNLLEMGIWIILELAELKSNLQCLVVLVAVVALITPNPRAAVPKLVHKASSATI